MLIQREEQKRNQKEKKGFGEENEEVEIMNMNANVGELNYGICKMINGEMHFFPCEFDAGTITRQMSEHVKVS